MHTRKSRRGASSLTEPLVSSELASGNSVTSLLGTSDEYTTRIEYSLAEEAGEGADGSSSASASVEEGSDDDGVGGDDHSERERTARSR
jgi:hypothetical protein